MNVLHLNTTVKGGAASAVYRLHKSMKREGFNSKIIVQSKKINDADVISIDNNFFRNFLMKVEAKLISILTYNSEEQGKYFWPSIINELDNANRILDKIPFYPDVIIVHWVNKFISTKILFELSSKLDVPIIWYMSDSAPLTGGCHYFFNCNNYTDGCKNCPAIKNKYFKNFANFLWKRKYYYINMTRICVIASSTFMFRNLEKSELFRSKYKKLILRGIDDKVFSPPEDKNEVRKTFDFKDDDIILFFGADSLNERRKGISLLLEALQLLYEKLSFNNDLIEKIIIVFAGNAINHEKFLEKNILFRKKYLGVLKTEQELATAYQLADAFICPTIQDSGPMMVSEALMCGTPIVGFDMGVLIDLVENEITGYRAELGNVYELSLCLEKVILLNKEERNKISNNCRKKAEKYITNYTQVENIKNCIKKLKREAEFNDKNNSFN